MSESSATPASARRLRRRHWLAGGAVALLALGWAGRIGIADHLIGTTLADLQLPGRYTVTAIDPSEQVLSDVALGDPTHPDLTARRVVVSTGLGGITGLRAEGVRLYGRVQGGRLSFGSLDALLNRPSAAPFRLPAWSLTLVDARASIAGDLGPIGAALSGAGGLADGFSGPLAVVAPKLEARHCRLSDGRFQGRLSTRAGAPHLAGPFTAEALDCPQAGVALARPVLAIAADGTAALDGGAAQLRLASGAVRLAALTGAGADGAARLTLVGGRLRGSYDLGLEDAAGAGLAARRLESHGDLSSSGGMLQATGQLAGAGVGAGAMLLAGLDRARGGAAGTLTEPLLAQLGTALRHEAPGSHLSASYTLHRDGDRTSVVIPQLRLNGAGGALLAAGSNLTLGVDGAVGGNLRLAGPLPQLTARLEPIPGGTRARVALAPWNAAGAQLAIPHLDATLGGGRARFAGEIVASGAVPGGAVEQLAVPVDGRWSAAGLLLGERCLTAQFAGARLGSLALGPGSVPLCPDGRALFAGGRVAARVPRLALAGRLGDQPVTLAGGPLWLAGGNLSAGPLAVALGQGSDQSRFALGGLDGRLGAAPAGHFHGGAFALAAVPLDISAAAGGWRWAGGRLDLSGLGFTVADRAAPGAQRFEPLVARDASLTYADGRISAEAGLRAPASGRLITQVTLAHRLADASGSAQLAVPGVHFDNQLQPDMLSNLALGLVANVAGTVSGAGRIDWAGGQVTSGGRFTTAGIDLAAPFGPARGIAGTVEFTDLLSLVTAPDQRLTIAAINPGIEVADGVLHFALQPSHVLAIGGAEWPFLEGRLRLKPTTMTLGATEVRHYVLEAEGIEAAEFLQKMEMTNIAATGRFDGALPLVFDANGGRIVGGQLTSRPPGGNVSYIGALTYKDLSPMANFAFATLKSLNYRQMVIGMEGSLAGELVTRLRIEGVSQGAGTKRNFLTRQVARLPLRFNINIRGRFFELAGLVRSTYDATYLLDPCAAGLIDAQGRPVKGSGGTAPALCPNVAQPSIQPSVSEKRP